MKYITKKSSQIFGKNTYKILSFVFLFYIAANLSCETKKTENSLTEDFHGVWIATVYNIDFPSSSNISVRKQKKELKKMLDTMKKAGIKHIIFQAKPAQEVFYKSKIFPYSKFIKGVYTNKLAYDPLKLAIKETHKRGMKFHAWFNPYRVIDYDAFTNYVKGGKESWLVKYGKYYWLDPAIPEVKDFVVEAVMEVVRNYDIDGVHLDDYFYPYAVKNEVFDDDKTFEKYGSSLFKNKEDFRRNAVTSLILDLNKNIKSEKQEVIFGISPFAVWRNKKDDKDGSETTAYQTSYDNLYADTKLWFLNGIVDYMAPQIYFDNSNKNAKFSLVLKWWEELSQNTKTQLYVGMPAYKVIDERYTITNFISNFNMAKESKRVNGMVYFSAKHIANSENGLKNFLRTNIINDTKAKKR